MVENYPSPETVQKYIKAKNELDKISYLQKNCLVPSLMNTNIYMY